MGNGVQDGSGTLELRVLGSPEVRVDGVAVPIRATKVRAFAAALMVRLGRTAPVGSLLADLWPDEPPRSALANLRTYATQLRRVLPADRLLTVDCGYRLVLDPDELDLVRSRRLVEAGRAALREGRPVLAAQTLGQARSLWRGRPLDGVALGPGLEATQAALDDEHRVLQELWIRAALQAGDDRVVAWARRYAAAEPLRESAQALLMHVQWTAGDSAAALRTYTAARRRLVEELGIEPGPELRRLHDEILHGDAAPVRPAAAPAHAGGAPLPTARSTPLPDAVHHGGGHVPHELPPAPPFLVGRDDLLARATARLTDVAAGPAVVAVHGPMGAGSSALAVTAARAVQDAFPDGVVHVDLAARPSVGTREVLDRVFRSFVPDAPAADCPDEAAARLRSLLHGRRVLVVLDNAPTADAVTPLLPTSPGAALLVTSRPRLVGLDPVTQLGVGPLETVDAVRLLERAGGRAFVGADRAHAASVAECCDHLPLALVLAAGRLACRPELTVAGLAERFVDESRRLDALEIGQRAMRGRLGDVVAQVERTHRGEHVARLYRALAAAPGAVSAVQAAALVPDQEPGLVADGLERLAHFRLLDAAPDGTFRMPTLIRLHARELVAQTAMAGPRRRGPAI
ncbi:BTAD domain-containing putative transcriptional regulator [Cellulomonas sp.]|uniref:AfsR/SARP family transcriptional regulator n=1 Tax=Cellulomonas sp. TaxID=40001 RepID=UPI00258EB864|nr:BTAD domain-containing putative transcriptional regulator [Cellulomonas sp.]MCR6690055.1 NB-ARC domain-containing protein [Cellulomonas sp.]